MFLPVKRVVDLNTKVFCFLDYFELIVANFQIQVFISTYETFTFTLLNDSLSPVFQDDFVETFKSKRKMAKLIFGSDYRM